MIDQTRTEKTTDLNFRLLSVAALINKVRNGITIDELYRDAERKFDILIELVSDTYKENTLLSNSGYSIDDLKKVSLLIFNQLISDGNFNPFVTLCVLEGASLKEVKRRRNKLLHIFHPDRNREEFSDTTKTRRINEAYEKIIDKYNMKDVALKSEDITIPRAYPYEKKSYEKRLILFLVIIVLLLLFFGFMKKTDFF
jgi:hypothetical protein